MGGGPLAGGTPRRLLVGAIAVSGMLAVPVAASAHIERTAYWPDPGPDTSVSPPAGGQVPTARSIQSAVTGAGPGDVRVVCQPDSLKVAKAGVIRARSKGIELRPSQ